MLSAELDAIAEALLKVGTAQVLHGGVTAYRTNGSRSGRGIAMNS
jgi:hypothetical protein